MPEVRAVVRSIEIVVILVSISQNLPDWAISFEVNYCASHNLIPHLSIIRALHQRRLRMIVMHILHDVEFLMLRPLNFFSIRHILLNYVIYLTTHNTV